MKIYVNANAGRDGNGTAAMPFRHINDAAKVAMPGDEVLVAPGIYREYVDPVHAGTEDARISYRSTEPLGARHHRSRAGKDMETVRRKCMGMPYQQQHLRQLQSIYDLRLR